MTYDEYKKLYAEWESNDSKSRGEEIEKAIKDAACGLLHKLTRAYAERGKDFVDDPDYQEGRGGCSLCKGELPYDGKTTIHLRYYDHWRYGGECDIGISIPMKYLDEDEFLKLEQELDAEYLIELERTLKSRKETIENWTKENSEIEAKISELKGEIGKGQVK